MLKLTSDGKEITGRPDQTIFEAAKKNGIYIPTLCYHQIKPAQILPHLSGRCRGCGDAYGFLCDACG
jgi:NADH dehydrogenase/NADH:ubiquinone oxidoreductase subunit G